MNKTEMIVKKLFDRYVEKGNIKNLDLAEKIYQTYPERMSLSWIEMHS